MKTIKNITILAVIAVIATLSACGGDDTPTPVTDPTTEVIKALGKSWTATSVSLDDADVTGDWAGFALTFLQSQGYSATNLSAESILVWPVSGSYTFPNANNANQILRNDGVQMTLSNVTETSATLSFRITGRTGRTDGLIGEWVFVMRS